MAIKLGNLILKSPTPAPVKEVLNASPANKPSTPESVAGAPVGMDWVRADSLDATRPKAEPAPAPTAKPAGIRLGGLRLGGSPAVATGSTPVVASVDVVANHYLPSESEVRGTPEGFQAKLDKLDRIVAAGISPLTIDSTRHYVKDIFIELRDYPQFDPIFKDRDMHNLMTFMQQTTIQAKELITEKKTKGDSKKAKAVNTQFGDFGSFGDPSTPLAIGNQVLQADAVGSALAAFGAVNTDGLEAKERRGRG